MRCDAMQCAYTNQAGEKSKFTQFSLDNFQPSDQFRQAIIRRFAVQHIQAVRNQIIQLESCLFPETEMKHDMENKYEEIRIEKIFFSAGENS